MPRAAPMRRAGELAYNHCVRRVTGMPSTGSSVTVTCTCGCEFCAKCLRDYMAESEPHRPAFCNDVRKWREKSGAESASWNWILANSRACPQCKRPIEKNNGCMHMTCTQCRFEFCWLCMGDWKKHGQSTGGFYNCNK